MLPVFLPIMSFFKNKLTGVITMSLLLILLYVGFSFLNINCKSLDFKHSNLEEREEASLSSYALCMRVMADGNSNVSGKNVSFCNDLKEQNLKEEEHKICVDALNSKANCYVEIWDRKNLKNGLHSK